MISGKSKEETIQKREADYQMKNKIKKFSKGNFEIAQPDVIFPETHLVLTIGEGEIYEGSFSLQTNAAKGIRGLVYSSSFRVHCKEQGFEGNPITIEYTYDGTHLPPGHVEQGKFTVVCNGGEYELPFTAIIEKPFLMTSYGKVQSTRDFKKLAFRDFSEAQKMFKSRDFYEILKYEDKRILYLYDNMRKWSLGEEALEEFLVGIKQKERIFLCLSAEEKLYADLKEDTKYSLTVTKNTWGYMPMQFEARGDFLRIIKRATTTDEFVGNSFELEYIVEHKKLHAGHNYGEIVIHTPYETVRCEIEVDQNGNRDEDRRECDFMLAQILKSYLGYEGGRKELGTWVTESLAKVKQMRTRQPDAKWYQLLQAQIHLIAGSDEEARDVLEHYNYNRGELEDCPESAAYYLFLTALLKKSGSHVNRVVEELNKLYIKNTQSWQILCMLLQIDPKFRNPSEKLRVLERQYFGGSNQIIVYLLAYECYREKNSRLKKLGAFEIQVLLFAVKYKLLTKELALYVANLASQQKLFNKHLFHILELTYAIYPDPMVLTAVCTLLIKGNKVSNKFFKWYQRALDAELKIAQLFEYYMVSIDEDRVSGALPRSIYLYFMHGNSLEYKKAALLYANVITYEDESSELSDAYREQIERFAWEQLEKRHINEQLRVIYKRFCREEDMTPERLRALYDICHAYKVTTKSKMMKQVLVIEQDGTIRQNIPYTEGGVQVFLYSKESRIVWEGRDGKHYIDSITYDTVRMFYELRFIEMYKKYASELGNVGHENPKMELTFENLHMHGLEEFDDAEVFRMCSKKIREENYEEDDFLSYVCYELFQKDQYDKVTLTYLANYYCGATRDMKKLWRVAKDYGVNTHKLAERIITQMLFSEDVFQEIEVFVDYYEGGAYFRLKQAYMAYIAREYVVWNRIVDGTIFKVVEREYEDDEYMADICKAATLKYYADQKYEEKLAPMLRSFLQELCEKQLIFPFYLAYPEEWLRETQLYDKTMVSYQAAARDSKVRIAYEIGHSGDEEPEYHVETMAPMYENIYVRQFILFDDEYLSYYFKETRKEKAKTSERQQCRQTREIPAVGKYGKLNSMAGLKKHELEEAMEEYSCEDLLAQNIFITY